MPDEVATQRSLSQCDAIIPDYFRFAREIIFSMSAPCALTKISILLDRYLQDWVWSIKQTKLPKAHWFGRHPSLFWKWTLLPLSHVQNQLTWKPFSFGFGGKAFSKYLDTLTKISILLDRYLQDWVWSIKQTKLPKAHWFGRHPSLFWKWTLLPLSHVQNQLTWKPFSFGFGGKAFSKYLDLDDASTVNLPYDWTR